MTVLRSWGNRLFGMERLSLSLSFTLPGPAIRVQDGIKKAEVLYLCVWEPEYRPSFLFFSCLLLHLTFFLSYCFFCLVFFLKEEETGQRRKERGKKLCMRKKQTSPKKNLAPSSARGQGYQSMSNSATTRLLFQIKTTYGRQTTSEQKRNPKRLADRPTETLYSSLLVSPQRQASTHPSFTVKIVFSFSFYLMLFSFLTHWQWGPDICRVHLKKKMCQGSVIPPPPSLSLSLFH